MDTTTAKTGYLFEAIERIARLYRHVSIVHKEYYARSSHSAYHDKLRLVHDFQECLIEMAGRGFALARQLSDVEDKLFSAKTYHLFQAVATLHKQYLHYLPRPSEPVELKRFTRIIDKKHIAQNKEVVIFPNEDISESTFSKEILKGFKEEFDYSGSLQRQEDAADQIQITIPRIDAENPCRWPTILHEIAHHLQPSDLVEKFQTFRREFGEERLSDVFEKARINQPDVWLKELWADLFAAITLGPVVYFSQWSAFLFADATYPVTDVDFVDGYPPAKIRLGIVHSLLQHRFPELMQDARVRKIVKEQEDVMEFLASTREPPLDVSFPALHQAEQLFNWFFVDYVFRKPEKGGIDGELHEDVQKWIKIVRDIDREQLSQMIDALKEGVPIPSVSIPGNDLHEMPSELPDILLAAWLYRQDSLRKDLWAVFQETSDDERHVKNRVKRISDILGRVDSAVLRSIQVSEWFDYYKREAPAQASVDITDRVPKGVLVDWEIRKALQERELRVIPIMNLSDQLGVSSLDVRLGTTFEIFHPNKFGLVDYAVESEESADYSEIVDLDILEGIVITPGQFLLGHTMEYVRLPNWIAAEIEGRSSFARLGLQVHMTAGFVDPGFEGSITLEIFNSGSMPVRLYPGLRIAQLRFTPVNAPQKSYSNRHSSKYKGLLAHHASMQMKDAEIGVIRREKAKRV